jgi:penicillin-binding protein 1C
MRTALGSSLNIPAVRTLVTVTPERFFRRLQSLGFNLRESGDYYGYSLALGSADVSLLSLTNAYRALANQGRYSSVRTAASDPRAAYQQAMDGSASFIVGDILSDRSARARTFGLESALSTRIWTAVKTGTSKDMRDNWCVGYSSRYTVGVWVGNASGAPMWDVSGVTGAAPVWQEVMQYLHRQSGSQEPSRPASVIAQPVQFENQLEAARTEYFLPGTQQSLLRAAKSNDIAPTISYPTPGMLVAIDPDIPPAHQRLRFSAQGVKQGNWVLDGKPLVRAAGKKTGDLGYDWMPWPGKHKLILQDVNGAVLDQLQFEVRGALVRPPEGKAVKVKGTVAK